MATRRRRPIRRTLKTVRNTGKRDRALSIAGQIGLHILTDPEAMRGAGKVLEVLGRAMQSTADAKPTTAATPLIPADVSDLSAFSAQKKKEPSDG
ncbi:hypothetical protein LCGC14_1058670 [marine sediment metagenome]|uniref:Uncharacterized protein n=1 Tax=marine sediment metagenome TaxID=412755 RepID=A0A0F9QSM8_9ZZZZ